MIAGLPPGKTQDVQKFTVQVIRGSDGAIVGTGFIVSTLPEIITCAHVVRAAGVDPRLSHPPLTGLKKILSSVFQPESAAETLVVRFPWDKSVDAKQTARVVKWFSDHDDDIVVLGLTGRFPVSTDHVAVLGSADDSNRNEFRSYGYRGNDKYRANWVDGFIVGPVETSEADHLHAEPVQLRSPDIGPGNSGGAVLDIKRNLVVGVISETFFAATTEKGRDDAWAVNARVLALDPLNYPLQDAPLPPRPTRGPDPMPLPAPPQSGSRITWNTAPPPIASFVGREALLAELTARWLAGDTRVFGLIGPAGYGKTSIARHWIEILLNGQATVPESVFWWSFNDRPSVSEFLQAALTHFLPSVADRISDSPGARVHLLASLLYSGRHVLVLDGLEVSPDSDATAGAVISSPALVQLLSYIASSESRSACVVTSRLPIGELMTYRAYLTREIAPIEIAGKPAELAGLAGASLAPANLSPLALHLLRRLIADRKPGESLVIAAGADGRLSVDWLLELHHKRLTPVQAQTAALLSVFRTPVSAEALVPAAIEADPMPFILKALGVLIDRGLLRSEERTDVSTDYYFAHPLIREYYEARLKSLTPKLQTAAHRVAAKWYSSKVGTLTGTVSREQLVPVVEMAHHLCEAADFDDAWKVAAVLTKMLMAEHAAHEVALGVLLDFFPDRDFTRSPLIEDPAAQRQILNNVGLCLAWVGRPAEAESCYIRKNVIARNTDDWINLSIGESNLAELKVFSGDLLGAQSCLRESIEHAQRVTGDTVPREIWKAATFALFTAHAYAGSVSSLLGDTRSAAGEFDLALKYQREIEPDIRFLYSNRGVYIADHLIRTGEPALALEVATENLQRCLERHWLHDVSRNHRVIGDIYLTAQTADSLERAGANYEAALQVARNITFRPALIEALNGHAAWLMRRDDLEGARIDLDEALELAASGYRLHEIDVRLNLAKLKLKQGATADARIEAERVLTLSERLKYHWGKAGARDLLAALH